MTSKQEFLLKYETRLAFLLVVFAWSTSWFMIKFQVGIVPETMSVGYRFLGASALLFLIAKLKKFPLSFSKKQHILIFLQGINLFFLNHLFFYTAINSVSSGIAATFSALSVIIAPLIDYLVHKNKFSKKLLFGGICGIVGVFLVSSAEIDFLNLDKNLALGLIFCFLGVFSFSFGSVIGKDLKLNNIKTLISSTAYSMLYGSLLSLAFALIKNQQIIFDFSFSYIFSLLYLIIFPGIIAYCSILFLVDKIGAAKASYTALLYPVFALIISGIFENYPFTFLTIIGIVLVAAGNLIALKSKK